MSIVRIFGHQLKINLVPAYGLITAVVIFVIFTLTSCRSSRQVAEIETGQETYVVMLSMDGWRWDYSARVPTPNLDRIAARGVMAQYVIPAFPTKTFPNHYSMATGLYPDNHGIVANNFYCPQLNLSFRLGDRTTVENPVFYGGEPIWVTAEKQGLVTASYFWVGSEAPVMGIQPTYWKRFDSNTRLSAQIDTVIYWLNLPVEKRPRLITLYSHQPDSHGHDYGPDAPEVDNMLVYLDSLVGDLKAKLSRLPIAGQINLIVTSDHGMTQLSAERFVDLSQHVRRNWFERVHGGNPLLLLQPIEGMKDSVYNILRNVDNLQVWRSGQLPERLNYGNNPRTLDLIVLADSTWSLGWNPPRENFSTEGGHGWDNAKQDMHTVFYAMGPAFRSNHLHQPIKVVDLYPLIAHILGLQPAQVDGEIERVRGMLRK
ncbi:MAG TPA: ectonucleotide pyrophosphatase/phosphodiesterase [Bacteroidales bacterium]|nr:ectonucleotide pyrophosphatase/phosphodiesterase [Bacteroidales bacterium]